MFERVCQLEETREFQKPLFCLTVHLLARSQSILPARSSLPKKLGEETTPCQTKPKNFEVLESQSVRRIAGFRAVQASSPATGQPLALCCPKRLAKDSFGQVAKSGAETESEQAPQILGHFFSEAGCFGADLGAK